MEDHLTFHLVEGVYLAHREVKKMLLLNINYIPDKKIETLGADAVISLTYTSSSLMQGAAEVTAYGTAVKIL